MASRPRSFSQLFSNNAELRKLQARAGENESLLHLVKSRLPDPVCDHCIAASLDGAVLQLIVDSPAWNTRLRFMQGTLVQTLEQAGMSIRQLKIITRSPDRPESPRTPRIAQALCEENAELIRQTAACIKDAELRQALERIARHSSPDAET